MARIRTIKPEFWTSEEVVECSVSARLMFIGLWNFCDDKGIHPYSIKTIKMEVFPGDDIKLSSIENWLNELIKNALIRTYHIDNKKYLIVNGWHHQKIEKPNQKYPSPLQFDDQSPTNQQPINDQTPEEWKGRESKGKESIKEQADAPFSLPSKEEIQEASDPMILSQIDKICGKLYEEKIFPEVNAFKNKMLKQQKNPRSLLHTLCRAYIKREFTEGPWAYCQQTILMESQNYNARDFLKTT
jgi:hypothetical protein